MKQYLLTALLLGLSTCAWSMEDLSDFNPAVSVIFDGLYYHDNTDGEGMERLEEAESIFGGHGHGHGHEHGHEHGGLTRGFNLRETELTLSGNVDPYFDAWFTAAVTEDSIEIEEAWIRTQSLPAGLQLKAGRMLSAVGYHNEKHLHSWQFADQNLAYLSLFGDHGLRGNGVQATWLAPTASFLQFGLEALQAEDLERFGSGIDGEEVAEEIEEELMLTEAPELNLDEKSGPKLGVAYVRFGPDMGTRQALQLGLSLAQHRDTQSFHEEEPGPEFFVTQGDATLYGLQAVYKFFPTGAYGQGGLNIQAEYFQTEVEETATYHSDPAELGLSLDREMDAGYLEANYGFAPRWQIGARHAATGIGGEISEGDETEELHISRRNSLALTWYATEFSKLRLQYSHNDLAGEDDDSFNQVMLQYNLSLGAHGAHQF
jgi:hypothetical protein